MEMNRNLIIMVAGAFFFGLLIGYGMLGEKESKKLDAKQMINAIVAEIDSMEKENRKLKSQLNKDMQGQIAKENESLKADFEKARNANRDLKKEFDRIKSELGKTEAKLKSNEVLMTLTDELKNEISRLEKGNAELKMTLETIGSLSNVSHPDIPAPVQKEIGPDVK